jgi:hypothetical protein
MGRRGAGLDGFAALARTARPAWDVLLLDQAVLMNRITLSDRLAEWPARLSAMLWTDCAS